MKVGWQTNKLGEVCSLLNRGISPKYLEQGGVCVLNQKCIRDHRIDYGQSRRHDLDSKAVNGSRFIQLGDVLVNSTGTGTLGRVAQIREHPPELTTVDSHVTIVRPIPNKFFTEFFGYMLQFIEDEIKEAGEGCGGQTELARSILSEKFLVTYPTAIPEQQRIVSILDQTFEGISTATTNAEKNLANARELFESYLYSVFTNTGEGWKTKSLGEVCAFENGDRGVNYPSKSVQTTSGIPFINAGHLTDDGVDFSTMNYIPRNRFDLLGAGKIRAGDILFCLRGSLGKCASVGNLDEGAIASSLVIIRPDDSVLNSFVLAYLSSHLCAEMIEKYRGGAAQPNLSAYSLKQFAIAVPPIDAQKSIMAKLDDLSSETRKLESIYQQKLEALDKLKKSILHQAFTGQLN